MKANQLYPEYKGGYGPGSYQPIIDDLGSILLQVDDEDYQGDSRVLIQKDEKYGILIFGWGSCSGCDALQACESVSELDELIEQIQSSVKWFDNSAECLHYFQNHDWQGDYSWHREETKKFINEAVDKLLYG